MLSRGRHRSTLAAAAALQRALEGFYRLERAPDVRRFAVVGTAGTRERLWVREVGGALELRLTVPQVLPRELHGTTDGWLQVVEGVSHFLYLAERARTELPATQLELELQAEVDKFVAVAAPHRSSRAANLAAHRRLFEAPVRFLHAAPTEAGARYRYAHTLACRFVARLVARSDPRELNARLVRFHRAGQAEKIALAVAA